MGETFGLDPQDPQIQQAPQAPGQLPLPGVQEPQGFEDNLSIQPEQMVNIGEMLAKRNDALIEGSFTQQNEMFPNLAKGMNKQRLLEIGDMVVEGYLADVDSRSEWESRNEQSMELYSLLSKSGKKRRYSDVKLPMLTMACAQFQARAFEELIPAKGIVKEVPFQMNEDNVDIAKRKSKYLNYLLMVKDNMFKRSMDASLLKESIAGTMVRKTYYDAVKRKVVSDYIDTSDFVISANTRWLEDSERYTQRLWMTENDIQIRMENKAYLKDEDILMNMDGSSAEWDEVKKIHLEAVGLRYDGGDDSNEVQTKLVLEQHVLMDLTGNKQIKKPYIITVDFEKRKVLRITSRMNPKTGEKMDFFTDYSFLPNPEGFYGYGFGLFLYHLNQALNSIANQLIDAGTFQNTATGLVLKKKGMKRGNIDLEMGKFIEVDPGTSDDLRKMILPLKLGEPSSVLFSFLGVLQQYADRLTTVTEQQTGNAQKSDTTATGVAILVEQGLKFFSAIHRRNHISFQAELTKYETMVGLYLDVDEYFNVVIDPRDMVNPETGQPVPIDSVRQMLVQDFNTTNLIVPVSNSNITSKEARVAKAEFIYNSVVQSPVTSQNMQAIYEAQRNLYEALDIPDAEIAKFLPTPPQEEPQDLPQEEENQMFLNDQYIEPLEQQDHQGHLQVIEEFEVSPFAEALTSTGKKFLDQHKRAHLGFLYIMQQGSNIQNQQNQQGQPDQNQPNLGQQGLTSPEQGGEVF